MLDNKPLEPPVAAEVDRLGGGHQNGELSLPPQGVEQEVDIPHADGGADGPPEPLPRPHLPGDGAEKARPEVSPEVGQAVLDDPAAGGILGHGVHGNAFFEVMLPFPHDGEGRDSRSWKPLPQLPGQERSHGVFAVAVGRHHDPWPEGFG
ncbi:hypothetical protein SDC9_180433 [bioreactor metagenome]|uniref:Uncharacterized protein n=1 Tax=bioreactor metagenome TaxID=1076179 RepID=A0A645H2P0_9ZZZZ